jgi:hypothetical protein
VSPKKIGEDIDLVGETVIDYCKIKKALYSEGGKEGVW